jgi:mannosyltransferase OCH1-like enzyme
MVPKIIHHIVGPDPSPLVDKCLRSWLRLKSHGYEIKIWNDFTIETFVEEKYPFVLAALQDARNYAEAADIARYAIIHYYGGYYVDWDIQLLDINKFFELSTLEYGFLIQDPSNKTLASECFSSAPNEPYLLRLVENISYIFENGARDSMSTPEFSGPFRMREVYLFTRKDSRQKTIPVKEIFLYDYEEIRFLPARDDSIPMIHYWEHNWIPEEE